jgi:hypothetical protein
MKSFGWVMFVLIGGYSSYLLIKSIPDIVRYVKLSSL